MFICTGYTLLVTLLRKTARYHVSIGTTKQRRMESSMFIVSAVAFLGTVLVATFDSANHIPELYCHPGEMCWPCLEDIMRLDDSMTGTVFQPLDSEYHLLSPANSEHYRRHPAIIAQVASTSDVQKVVLFAQKFNIRLTIYSTGSDYNGRSTAHGSLQISMVNMKRIDINMADSGSDTGSSVTVQTGNTFGRIYQAVDRVGKVVVGGFDQNVGPGGYTAGGGHGPLSRSLGLAADNCIAATIVIAGGYVAYLNSTGTTLVALGGQVISIRYTELFWAIRGGGGGTFGVVIDYTFKLHEPPAQLVQYVAQYPIDFIGESVINLIHQLIPTLPNQWFGLFVYAVPPAPIPGVTGIIMINMLHYGPWEQATRMAIQPLEQFLPAFRIKSQYINHTSFWSFVQASTNPTAFRGYFAGILVPVQKLAPPLSHFYVNYVRSAPVHLNGRLYVCAEITIGGRITELNVGVNAVSQHLRQAIVSIACFLSWSDPRSHSVGEALGRTMAAELYQHSQGVYQNEPAFDLPNWREDFWGQDYKRLLKIKRTWDMDNVFYCRHCVGDESNTPTQVTDAAARVMEGPAN